MDIYNFLDDLKKLLAEPNAQNQYFLVELWRLSSPMGLVVIK